jgi:hypothetical protein
MFLDRKVFFLVEQATKEADMTGIENLYLLVFNDKRF